MDRFFSHSIRVTPILRSEILVMCSVHAVIFDLCLCHFFNTKE